MNIRFYEWPNSQGYFLVLAEGASGQLGHIDRNADVVGFSAYLTVWEYTPAERDEIFAIANKFAEEQRALKQVTKRLKS